MIIEPQYLPNILYISTLISSKQIFFNDTGIFKKQTYRNRTYIMAANKVLPLIIPLKSGKTKIPYKDVRIDHQTNWTKIHWQSIISAYNKSPYFFYYRDYFEKYFIEKYSFLVDINLELLDKVFQILQLELKFSSLSSHNQADTEEQINLTDKIHPKKNDSVLASAYKEIPYNQVFNDRFGFVPGISIIDLLFNTGPEAIQILREGMS